MNKNNAVERFILKFNEKVRKYSRRIIIQPRRFPMKISLYSLFKIDFVPESLQQNLFTKDIKKKSRYQIKITLNQRC